MVVVCGRNERLRREIEETIRHLSGTPRVIALGYVENLPDYLAASDVVVGKSGPNQVFETLLQETPIIISSFLANEKRTSDWVLSKKVGWLCRTPQQFLGLVRRLMSNPAILQAYRKNVRELGLTAGAREICAFLYGLLQDKKE